MRMADARKRLGLVVAILIAGSLATAYTDHVITTREEEMSGELQEASQTGAAETVGEMIRETEILAESLSQEAASDENAPTAAAARSAALASADGEAPPAPSLENEAPAVSAAGVQAETAAAEDGAAVPEAAAEESLTDEAALPGAAETDAGPGVAAAAYSAGPGAGADAAAETSGDSGNEYAKWQRRLNELDSQIQTMRDEQTGSAAVSIKAMADTELNLWEKEMGSIYGEIMEQLDELGREELARTQRQWMNERDAAAEKVIPSNSGSSIESAEYTASLAESTRARAYALLEEYQEYLKRL